MKDQEAFRERVFKSFKEDFLNRQPESRRERLNRVMSFLSFVSPTPKKDALFNNAAEILGCQPLEVGEDVETLQAAGLVVENREGIRLYPDLFADAVLLDACVDQKGRPSFLHRTILSKLQIADFPALMRNLAQADWETRPKTGETGSLFEPVWQEFVRRFQEGVWVNNWATAKDWLVEPYLEGGPKEPPPRPCPVAQPVGAIRGLSAGEDAPTGQAGAPECREHRQRRRTRHPHLRLTFARPYAPLCPRS